MNIKICKARGPALAAMVAGCFAVTAGAQQPAAGNSMGRPANPQAPAQQPGTANQPGQNRAANPADAGDTGAIRSGVSGAAPASGLTLDRFNGLDQDKDGVLTATEFESDKGLAGHFDDMDTDRNREIDDVEFMGFTGEPADEPAAGGG